MTIKLLLVLVLSGVLVASSQAASTDSPPTPNCPSYNPPDELTLVAGTPQSAKLGTPFDTNLEVALASSSGCPITTTLAGGAVTFRFCGLLRFAISRVVETPRSQNRGFPRFH